jgi:YD repeat-containing protein
VYKGDAWTIARKDGWKFYMPYRPKALPQNVTVLTGFSDPAGNMYRMDRDSFGDLLSITTPAGEWLHFQHDSAHRVQRIEGSTGRAVDYEYDPSGCLSRVTDSDGHTSAYTYDDKAQMRTVSRDTNAPALTNTYDSRGNIKTQTTADGQRFEYHYVQNSRNLTVPDLITTPNGLLTHIRYAAGRYTQSLPMNPPR